jgi:hypothetical protein
MSDALAQSEAVSGESMNKKTNELRKELISESEFSRRDLLYGAAKASIVVAALSALPGCGGTVNNNSGSGSGSQDVAIFQFALNLEYLEAEFYTYATTGAGIEALGISVSGFGTAGPTTGGVKTTFTDSRLSTIATEIASDERKHVVALRSALGAGAIAKPAIALDFLLNFSTQSNFLVLARAFEDVGVSAYAGAAPALSSGALQTAARILATEALHAGAIRLEVAINSVATSTVDSQDVLPPPSGASYFGVDASALAISRTTRQVLDIVYGGTATAKGGFFPNGFNGQIQS